MKVFDGFVEIVIYLLGGLTMKKLKNGDFTQTVNLDADAEYAFRYLIDDETWENDWQADAYRASPVSMEENSIVKV